MTPPTLPLAPSHSASQHRTLLSLEPLTPSSFSEFGTAICAPFDSSLTTPPRSSASIPVPLHAPHQPAPVFANQNSALKTSPISQFSNNYPKAPASKPQMSMFSCFPRNLSGIGVEPSGGAGGSIFRVSILERHPYTTQTFSPLGLSAASDSSTFFLVVVAPSLPSSTTAVKSTGSETAIANPPDLARLRAFLARGDQAVTYGPGTWHAPMVVLGQRRVDFLVTQFVNGVAEDDCQEVLLGQNDIGIDLSGLGLDGFARPKL
ncbi:uncharacterized protein PV07_10912 [Cladophialophora immunda]|uniref:Ureidoglycolate hydrolase n=1 Tax=Cladophialophora immunda TaxID=569365 RepID=A0A0D2BU84_9EURO|nr:uncharacterized protein PV07_10912 [Cladophialophora immunda]KIW22633.1 hypothetical protein PV07_10912 [Cladophialophora immunda]OQV02247.1 hypothetical protein CLAIMM_07480 isoform 1 [Cladophialophora immunda]OQV02248.1 hypothetical protein CLAIMM_07480 isoform 2 [Cladophialophora immunda]